MTIDEIIHMAKEAGMPDWLCEDWFHPFDSFALRFAYQIAAAEREACAKVAEDTGNISGNMNKTWRNGCFDAADAIRARGQG